MLLLKSVKRQKAKSKGRRLFITIARFPCRNEIALKKRKKRKVAANKIRKGDY
jgi:hypothetical protein